MKPDFQPWLDWITSQQDALLARTLTWSAINSGSYHKAGVDAMRALLARDFAVLGGETTTIPVAPLQQIDSHGNPATVPLADALSIRKRPEAPLQVFLCGHMDTVFDRDSPFQTPVYLDDNTINGPGVADLKGGLSVMLTALQALEQSPWADQIGWEILLNPDEEIGSPGSAPLLREAAQRNHFGMIYEPALADGTLAGARKGSGNFTAIARGKAAHAGREHALGRNAIVAIAHFVAAIDQLNGQQPGLTVNPALLEGGGPNNIVPDLAIARFNIRVETPAQQQWAEQQLQAIVTQINALDGITLTLNGQFGRPPKPLSAANTRLFQALADCGETLGIPVQWQATGGCCDGNNLVAAGLPNIDTLGVRGGAIHSDQEFLLIDSLTERAQLSALLLMRFASGNLQWPMD